MGELVWIAFAIAILAAVFDLATKRIPNWLTLSALVTGLIVQLVFLSPLNFAGALAAVVLAFLLYFPIYALGVMGAGDVKMLMAIAAWVGVEKTLLTAAFAILLGGGYALIDTARRGRLLSVLREIYRVLREALWLQTILRPLELDRKTSFSFGVVIALALPLAEMWGTR